MTVSVRESIDSLRRAQELVDRGVIGQTSGYYIEKKDGKVCLCAIGAIAADRLQPKISSYSNQVLTIDGFHESDILYVGEIMDMNDDDNLSFGEIANTLEGWIHE